jgi:hypothetical protein
MIQLTRLRETQYIAEPSTIPGRFRACVLRTGVKVSRVGGGDRRWGRVCELTYSLLSDVKM